MNTFTIILQDATRNETIVNVVSFRGGNTSGNFTILAGHERLITSLNFGLANFRVLDQSREYLAVPGALIYFTNNNLVLSTRRYLRDPDYLRISLALHEQFTREEQELQRIKLSLYSMEEEMLKRLWLLGRGQERQT